ncbi:thiaminase II [Planomicrobium sp. CPCC 101110]|uniref:thiaminase II n=1 Tax=Planomicrobium sp. CPCC 101110 TaxID=2599619 RepID=UPI0011B6BED7|nr:thiaminase II [Planomicrobium sp. CPCC 101110]TWT25821.1 thiaminase II [Planomicrobium sp. CPCC 101110]
MTFSEELWQEAEPIFEACYQHPFVQGIAKGQVDKEQLVHYVKQDFEYLNAMIQTKAFAMAKCTNREDMEMFNASIGFILNSEVHPHRNFCEVAGVQYEDLQGFPLAPTALNYINHMLIVSQTGTLGEAIAVSLPCPWIYLYIGERIIKDYEPEAAHPFYDWIRFYGAQEEPRMNAYINKMDFLAEGASEQERQKMKEHFILSCQYEYAFFDMAYKLEEWPTHQGTSLKPAF